MRALLKGWTIVAVSVFLAACAGGKVVEEQQYSGFLKDYSQLKQEKDEFGQPVLRYVSPELSSANYRALLIEPVRFYPEPQPTQQVTAETLVQILQYFDQALREKLGQRVTLTDQPGPGVVRMRVAITGVATEKAALAPREYIPIGLVIAGAREATGARAKDAVVYTEAALEDAVTGKRLGAFVKRGVGEKVKAGEHGNLTLDNLKPLLDRWAQSAADFAKRVRGR